MIWREDLAEVHIRLTTEAWRLTGPIPKKKKRPLVCTWQLHSQLLVTVQPAGYWWENTRCPEGLSNNQQTIPPPHRSWWVAIKLKGSGSEESVWGRSANMLSVVTGEHTCLTIQGRGCNVLLASVPHWSCSQTISNSRLHSWCRRKETIQISCYHGKFLLKQKWNGGVLIF